KVIHLEEHNIQNKVLSIIIIVMLLSVVL
ncbi:hypothetical protein Q0O88_14285, partial [Staphylococcus aureus]|nr:hypothetical protein [Staphylococcus aureus]